MEKLFTTRKIRLLIDSDDIDQKNKVLDTLYQWRYICFKAANQIFTHHYVQQQLREILYLTKGVRAKLSDIKKDEYGILSTSRMNQLSGASSKLQRQYSDAHHERLEWESGRQF